MTAVSFPPSLGLCSHHYTILEVHYRPPVNLRTTEAAICTSVQMEVPIKKKHITTTPDELAALDGMVQRASTELEG